MFCFGILRIFGEKSQHSKNWKIWAYRVPTPQRREPHHGVDLRQGVGYLTAARTRCQNGTPRVRRGVAKLRHGEVLCRSVATVHSEQISDFCFQTPHIHT